MYVTYNSSVWYMYRTRTSKGVSRMKQNDPSRMKEGLMQASHINDRDHRQFCPERPTMPPEWSLHELFFDIISAPFGRLY